MVKTNKKGYNLVPLATIVFLIGFVILGSMTLLGTRVSETFSNIDNGLGGGDYEGVPNLPPAAQQPESAIDVGLATQEEPETSNDLSVEAQKEDQSAFTSKRNPFIRTEADRLSTFALDVDTASYTMMRGYIEDGMLPPQEMVRIEEFVNYFDYAYPNPEGQAMGIFVDGAPAPWSMGGGTEHTQIVRVGIQGKHIDDSQRNDVVLTFVIDISGSMAEPNRLPMVKESLSVLVDHLRPSDQVGIVVYSDNARVILEHTSARNRQEILQAINSLQIEGSTYVEDGLRLGYEQASAAFVTGANNRVILCSDGVANIGATGPDAILRTIRDYTEQGVYLTTVGFGMGDYQDYLMEQLANDGNGNYAYVDTIDAARRIFVEDLTGTFQVIAKDAKVQVDFNPAVVERYRLLGYENRDVADEDFRNDTVDAGEVGAGHNVTALYEVVMKEKEAGTALSVHLRYEDPDTGEVYEIEELMTLRDFAPSFEESSPRFQLAVAVASFANRLQNNDQDDLKYVVSLAKRLAPHFKGNEDVQEFVKLVEQAARI